MPISTTANRRIVSRSLRNPRLIKRIYNGMQNGNIPFNPNFSLVQNTFYGSTASSNTHNVTFNNTPTQNYLCIWVVTSDDAVTTPAGLSIAASAVVSTGTYIFYRVNGSTESSTTTFTLGGALNDSFGCLAFEYSGMATTSVVASTQGSATGQVGTTPTSGTTGTTSQTNTLVVAAFGSNTSLGATSSGYSNSFIDQGSVATSNSTVNVKIYCGNLKAASISTYSTVLTVSLSAYFDACIVAFKITNP